MQHSADAGLTSVTAIVDAADAQCRIDWALIAAIGKVESNHGRYGGNGIDTSGTVRPGIYGIPLNGSNDITVFVDGTVHRLPPAAEIRLVDDVVVHERRGVDELDDRRVADVLPAFLVVVEQPRREQQERGPDPLPSPLGEMPSDPVDRRNRRAEVEEQLPLDLRELVRDQVVRSEEARVGRRRGKNHR